MTAVEFPESPPEPAPTRTRPVYRAACYLLGLAVAAGLVAPLEPIPGYFREKYLYFSENKDLFDIVFFGSSLTQNSVSPEWFDKELSDRGIRLHSFNFGFAGSDAYEAHHLIEQVLKLKPRRLKWVMVDWLSWEQSGSLVVRERDIWWHTPRHTLLALRGVLAEEREWNVKADAIRTHLTQAFLKFCHVGQGPRLIASLRGENELKDRSRRRLHRRAGFLGLDDAYQGPHWPGAQEGRRAFLREQAKFGLYVREHREELRRFEAGNVTDSGPEHFPQTERGIARQVRMLRSAGIEPIYIVYPANSDHLIPRRLQEQGIIPHLFLLDDPDRYPELYQPEHRFDWLHFNRTGARVVSRLLAQRFAELHASGNAVPGASDPKP